MFVVSAVVGTLRKARASLGWINRNGLPWRQQAFFPFIQPHEYLTDSDFTQFEQIIFHEQRGAGVSEEYARVFAASLGGGYATPVASARMALFALLRAWNVQKGDEVIVTGFTCSVVINAVLRSGARPVYVDIDPATLGTCPRSVQEKLTDKTRVVIAQHSMGFACDVSTIKKITEPRGIKLVEDVAIAYGTTHAGRHLGAWGDAAIFSTDHSKPLNTLVGGMVFTQDRSLHERIEASRSSWGALSGEKQRAILRQIRIESKTMQPLKAHQESFKAIWAAPARLSPFLDADYAPETCHNAYPYPAELPPFLAALALKELERWSQVSTRRRERVETYTAIFRQNGCEHFIPPVFRTSLDSSVPLRFTFCLADDMPTLQEYAPLRQYLESFMATSWIWFQQPIVCTSSPLSTYSYEMGMCPQAESIGQRIVTIPLVFSDALDDVMTGHIRAVSDILRR